MQIIYNIVEVDKDLDPHTILKNNLQTNNNLEIAIHLKD